MSDDTIHICVVCSGNICRSPIGAVVLTERLRRAGLDDAVRVSSAGIGPWHVGEDMDPRARDALRAHGYDGEHTARQVDGEHLGADLLLAADTGHLRALRRSAAAPERVRLLREFDPEAPPEPEIADPYYDSERGFDEALAMIERAADGIVAWARERQ